MLRTRKATTFQKAIRIARENYSNRAFPDLNDSRVKSGLLFPAFTPKFQASINNSMVFTIGSCFARNMEEVLALRNARVPTMDFAPAKSEYRGGRSNYLLNEDNPGSIWQRILFALRGEEYPAETIVPVGDLHTDLLLSDGGTPVTLERALARRREIASVYENLARSPLVIVTLGLIEAWFDNETKLYLNQAPPPVFAASCPSRFEFRRLDVIDCVTLLEEALNALIKAGIKILLMVSPVPLTTTFTGSDCIVANEFSKSVLRVTAGRLANRQLIDYFPAYEIVRSGGLASYEQDCIHVKEDVVERVVNALVDGYAYAEVSLQEE